MDSGVHLGGPGHAGGVGLGQVVDRQLLGDHEVGLHVTHQVLGQTLIVRRQLLRPATIGSDSVSLIRSTR